MSKNKKSALDLLSRVLILLIIMIVMACLKPEAFLTKSNFSQVIFQQAPFTMLMSFGMGMAIITGGIDISMASVMILSSYLSATSFQQGNYLVGVLIAVGVGVGFGLASGLLISKVHIAAFIATYSVDFIALGLAYVICDGKYIYGFPEGFRKLTNGSMIGGVPNIALVTLVIFIILYVLTKKTRYGRGFYSIGFNPKATKLSGINADWTICSVYVMNGLLAAITGILYLSRLNAADPSIKGTLSMDSIASSLIGGIPFSGGEGSVLNAVVGALIIVFIRNGMNILNVPNTWSQTVVGFVIMFALIYGALMDKVFTKVGKKEKQKEEAAA